jgi:Mycotoxin biosynthesis protein UstYa
VPALRSKHLDLLLTLETAPIIKSHIPFRLTQFTSAPLSSYNNSIYRQPPSPSVDAAWDRLADIGTHIISSSEVLQLGKDPKKAVRVPRDWGYGDDAHIATIDGIHLVHCLNSMRKSLKMNFDYYYPDPLGPEYIPHLSHCVESVLQHLMCRPSLELLTQNWIERQNAPFPDFGINKKCWDYEAILDWKERNRVLDIENRFKELKPPAGAVREPLPPLVAETWDIIEGTKENSI